MVLNRSAIHMSDIVILCSRLWKHAAKKPRLHWNGDWNEDWNEDRAELVVVVHSAFGGLDMYKVLISRGAVMFPPLSRRSSLILPA